MIPTKEQIQWLWEQCGFRFITDVWEQMSFTKKNIDHSMDLPEVVISDPTGKWIKEQPPIDLNNLFRYAVPKLIQKIGKSRTAFVLQHWVHEVAMHDEDPALALSWAIYKALGGVDA